MHFRAEDVFRFLIGLGYESQGDEFTQGGGWFSDQGAVLMLPHPDVDAHGQEWFDADVIIDIFMHRQVWLSPSLPFPIYP